ncbi:MAG TPA: hypothetical protein VGK40_09935 [Verrucomicrobiae bacterium]|jgi:hypothetical protein
MKNTLVVVLAASLGFAVASVIVSNRLAARHAVQLAEQQAAWQAEKAELEAALENAKSNPRIVTVPGAPAPAPPAAPAKLSPAEIVARLRGLKSAPGAGPTRTVRQAVHSLEELIAAGPEALPAIREFLARHEDIDFEFAGTNQVKSGRSGNVPNEFILPPSLRFGMFDAVKQIGGAGAEKVLAEVLGTTGRGVEVAWLARILQDMAPNKYRDAALAAARELLGHSLAANSTSPLDRNDRDNLFSVLTMYGDSSYASTAQVQLVRADGQVDRSALKYLQQSLGQQAVPIAAQLYDDPRLADPSKKEPLARVALNYVGADAQANAFYQKAINDLNLPKDDRRNLIEDLNQDGFADRKNFTARDLQLIQNRLALIEQLAPDATDPINAAAFKEAYKDLLKMRERILNPTPPPGK